MTDWEQDSDSVSDAWEWKDIGDSPTIGGKAMNGVPYPKAMGRLVRHRLGKHCEKASMIRDTMRLCENSSPMQPCSCHPG